MSEFFYITALALLTTHELDAVARREWRIFPLLNKLDEPLGATLFTAVHIPLFWAIFWLSWHPDPALRDPFRTGFAAFCIIHVILHMALSRHPANQFNNPMSQFLIWSCGGAGVLYLGPAVLGG